jgi:hypothetical protein
MFTSKVCNGAASSAAPGHHNPPKENRFDARRARR